MKNANSDIMQYLDGMEITSHEILDKVENLYNNFDYNIYTSENVKKVLNKEILDLNDYAVLLSPVAGAFLV